MNSPDRAAPPAPPTPADGPAPEAPAADEAAPARRRVQVVSLRPEGLSEDAVGRVAGLLAEAFAEDEFTLGLLPADRRAERLARMFALDVHDALRPARAAGGEAGPRGAVDVALDPEDGTLLAAALWDGPDAPRGTTVPGALAALPARLRVHGRRTWDAARTDAACERARPAAAHWYLTQLGTAPAARGREAASALVRLRQRRAARAGVGIHLEASSAEAVPFYARLGFRETGTVRAHGTRDLTAMWWEAQA